MENKSWRFNKDVKKQKSTLGGNEKKPLLTVKDALTLIRANINPDDERPVIPMGHGDPSPFPCFRTTAAAEDAVVDAIRAGAFNGYAPIQGHASANKY